MSFIRALANKKKRRKSIRWRILSLLGSLLFCLTFVTSSSAHWADLAVAEVVVSETEVQITLTFPTGLADFADENKDGQLSAWEVRDREDSLKLFLSDRIRLTDSAGNPFSVAIKPLESAAIPAIAPEISTHTTLLLSYAKPKSQQNWRIYYNLFLPGVPTASCQATILQNGQIRNFTFTPTNQNFSLSEEIAPWSDVGNFLFAILGCFVWGASHAMSPGHGKTIVGAYLVGSRATVKHVLFLALTTTITHTAGVFALGLATLVASAAILPERLYPWLSLLSGLTVAAIGINLCIGRLNSGGFRHKFKQFTDKLSTKLAPIGEQGNSQTLDLLTRKTWERKFTPEPSTVTIALRDRHSHPHHPHSHHPHHHGHSHGEGEHSHLPPGADGEPITWKSLLALGISGGILPCPSALVVLLSATALGKVGFGLALVVAFSLGLAAVLAGIGLLLIYARRQFDRLPKQIQRVPGLSVVSAAIVVLLGCGLAVRSLAQIVNN